MKDCDITNCFLDGMSTHHWGNNFKVIYRLETDIGNSKEPRNILGDSQKRYSMCLLVEYGKSEPRKEPIRFRDSLPCE